jgi:hypothetical protein
MRIIAQSRIPLLLAVALFGLSGCARVQPWEREQLAKDIMSFELDERERALQRVIDKSQYEGVIGGGTTEGSGCGCN